MSQTPATSNNYSTHGNKGKVYRSKNPDSPKRADYPDDKSYRRAYSAYFAKKNPGYLKEWQQRPENIERYSSPPVEEIPPCHRCGAELERGESGHLKCMACAAEKERRSQEYKAARAAASEKRKALKEQMAQRKAERDERALKAKEVEAEHLRQKAARDEIRNLKAKRPHSLTDGFFLLDDEWASFRSKLTEDGECLIWRGGDEVNIAGIKVRPQRLLWFLESGTIPPGMVLNKACETKGCVCPAHRKMEPATPPKGPKPIYKLVCNPIPVLTPEQEELFESKINKDGDCWVWTGKVDEQGYGRSSIGGILYHAHRVAFHRANGFIDNNLQVHHQCDSSYCVNPSHLTQGDYEKNNLDAYDRGRMSDAHIARLIIPDTDERKEIARLLSLGVKETVISKKFGVSLEIISQIKDGTYNG